MRQLSMLGKFKMPKASAPATLSAAVLMDFQLPVDRAEFYDRTITDAVLMLNRRERETEDPDLKKIFIDAQDWICEELDDVSSWVLREL